MSTGEGPRGVKSPEGIGGKVNYILSKTATLSS